MKCPICKEGTLAFCRDAIIASKLVIRGEELFIGKVIDINELDNTWIECSECGASSNDDGGDYKEELFQLYEKL